MKSGAREHPMSETFLKRHRHMHKQCAANVNAYLVSREQNRALPSPLIDYTQNNSEYGWHRT